jgi:hypothetical protein
MLGIVLAACTAHPVISTSRSVTSAGPAADRRPGADAPAWASRE